MPTTAISTLSLHDALPISTFVPSRCAAGTIRAIILSRSRSATVFPARSQALAKRSEEHTSELQSRFDLVCRLLLEKKNLPRGDHLQDGNMLVIKASNTADG